MKMLLEKLPNIITHCLK